MSQAAHRPTVKRPRRAEVLDLFGEVPVSRPDVYAWLLAVVDLDPESFRAEAYIRNYRVLDKIVAAKLDGTFDEIVAPARASARFRELSTAGTANPDARNTLGVGEVAPKPIPLPLKPALRSPRRSPEVIAREREQAKIKKRQRQKVRASLLNRLPGNLPSMDVMLGELGDPDAEALAAAFQVHPTSARRWLRHDDAPHAVRLALFWLTKWGVSIIETNAYNDAVNSERVARLHEIEADQLRANLARVARIADFGSANDPLPTIKAQHPPAPSAPTTLTDTDTADRSEPSEPGEPTSRSRVCAA